MYSETIGNKINFPKYHHLSLDKIRTYPTFEYERVQKIEWEKGENKKKEKELEIEMERDIDVCLMTDFWV